MKKYMICALLHLCLTNSAMNNNDTRPVRFASADVLYNRLRSHDQKNNTMYASFSRRCSVHDTLGNAVRLRSQANTFIKFSLRKDNPDFTEQQIIEHKRNIINIFRPELAENTAKL